MLDHATKTQVSTRLKRIEGQIRGIAQMVDEGQYCIDIITQLHAARRALEQAALLVMQQHMRTCLTEAIQARKGDPKINELIETLDRFLR
ncbi:MAG: metal-sensitive transcriptional regulator [Deltaproteobacteria bacterium]|nr:metal-sensitive transcriptional regulator [Deltaproteobacteria bacterium]